MHFDHGSEMFRRGKYGYKCRRPNPHELEVHEWEKRRPKTTILRGDNGWRPYFNNNTVLIRMDNILMTTENLTTIATEATRLVKWLKMMPVEVVDDSTL